MPGSRLIASIAHSGTRTLRPEPQKCESRAPDQEKRGFAKDSAMRTLSHFPERREPQNAAVVVRSGQSLADLLPAHILAILHAEGIFGLSDWSRLSRQRRNGIFGITKTTAKKLDAAAREASR